MSEEISENRDDLIVAQKEAIYKEIAEHTDLVGQDANNLKGDYFGFRRTRPDGNCFFRALGFRYFEILLKDPEELKRFKEIIKPSKDIMATLGFPSETVLEDFYDNFMEALDKLETIDHKELVNMFNDQGVSDYIVVFLRLLTSMQLQKDADFYQNFMEGDQTVVDFCKSEVETMFRESDHIHVIALTAATSINVRILYLDRGSNKEASPHDFPDGSMPKIHLLYRPGHYDVLYPR
ncbi:OTUB1 [Lepeophtheirus salmonis]|uniref:ubiquitinyl hydrolase 1 n=1 Tax=Lepeophtheirus salmonis TaxID=72036 RepID=A0A7R8HDG1_LEPSM|nr:OTUB1 [Lepeophtheirus salmonis]CAF3022800.1 OTUB1 [Lepeophtheirus salmonis]